MDKHIRLLDCTLRDGGHINEGEFGEVAIRSIIERLIAAGIDIIEIGFLWEWAYGTDTARYYSIKDVKKILPEKKGNSKFSLMADFIDLRHLEPYDGTVDFIRLSFKRSRWDWAMETAQILMDKGYKVIINPVNNNVYSDKEYIECIERVNELHPYGFSIVDTFGVMRVSDLLHRYSLVENNLLKDIVVGFHFHENLGLAYSLAQQAVQIADPVRRIIIDGSLLGMGRVPGNLCIEQFMEYMNERFGSAYVLEPVYDAIDDYIAPIKKNTDTPWGYATPYALSAKYNLHRTYAEYLMGKQRLRTKDIQRILQQIDRQEAELFNEEYIEKLYLKYIDVIYDDKEDRVKIKQLIGGSSKIVVVAPGKSINAAETELCRLQEGDTFFISVNFCPSFIREGRDSIVFLTNKKRYDLIKQERKKQKLLITSNLIQDVEEKDYVINYNSLVYFQDEYCDDSTLMLLKLLFDLSVKEVYIAGFDGTGDGKLAFYDKHFGNGFQTKSQGNVINRVMKSVFSEMRINFLTDSEYTKEEVYCNGGAEK